MYSRLRQLERWILFKIRASNSTCLDLGSEYDEKFALAIAKCSESQIPLLLETMEENILKCDSMTTYVMRRLVSNCHVSSVTAKEIRNRVERVLDVVQSKSCAMTRALMVLCDRCDVFLGLDPFKQVSDLGFSESCKRELSSRDEFAQYLDLLCRERQHRLQSRFTELDSFNVEEYVKSCWRCLLDSDHGASWISVRNIQACLSLQHVLRC